jgi:enoyl-CoA hydratase
MREFAAAIEKLYATPTLKVLIITGAGKAFISGGDVAELHGQKSASEARRMITLMGNALTRLESWQGVTIAAMEGAARGGGCEVATACDLRIAAETATFGFVQIRLGLITGWGGASRLQRCIGYANALDLLATGRVITAADAQTLGFVNRLVPTGTALQHAQQLAAQMATAPIEALSAYKRILQAAANSPSAADALEREIFPQLWVSDHHQQAVEAFLKR